MIKIDNKSLEDKLKNIEKYIEVLGGNSELKKQINSKEEIIMKIVNSVLKEQHFKIVINDKEYNLSDMKKEKIEFEKHIIKNKSRVIKYILHSVKEHNKKLTSLIKKYLKDRDAILYKEIESSIIRTYKEDINKLLLVNCDIDYSSDYDENIYYGEYLNLKREEIIQSIINKI